MHRALFPASVGNGSFRWPSCRAFLLQSNSQVIGARRLPLYHELLVSALFLLTFHQIPSHPLIDKVKFHNLRWLFCTELSFQLQWANERSQVVAFGGPAVALSFYTQATPKSLVLGDYHCTMNSRSQGSPGSHSTKSQVILIFQVSFTA